MDYGIYIGLELTRSVPELASPVPFDPLRQVCYDAEDVRVNSSIGSYGGMRRSEE